MSKTGILKNFIMRSKIAKRIQSETPEEVRIFVRQYANIVLGISELIKSKCCTQKDPADKLNKQPSEINKWLEGNHNLTLKTIAKLKAQLGEPIIYVKKTS